MKVHLRDLKNGPFQLSDIVKYEQSIHLDDRIQKMDEIEVSIRGNKFSDSIVLDVSIDSNLRINCDRCADEIGFGVNDKFNILLTKNENLSDFSHKDFDIVVEIKDDDIEVDITSYIFEGVNLSLPMRVAPSENDNGECSVCLKDFDFKEQQPEQHRKEFDKLKNLFK